LKSILVYFMAILVDFVYIFYILVCVIYLSDARSQSYDFRIDNYNASDVVGRREHFFKEQNVFVFETH
jgi:hypothetical protein